ncbi:hypothetical protein ACHQM5_003830 [Ranunculus cassubicifolius]
MVAKKHCSSFPCTDMIGHMPDPIRSHIVSFLPLKDAIRTSILSRRWRRVCSSLSSLDFRKIRSRNDIKDIIDQTLFLNDGSNVKRFKLVVKVGKGYITDIHLHRWISFALRHSVCELSLVVHEGELTTLPSSLFTSSTLTSLTLSDINLNLPSKVYFPVLKTVDLDKIFFFNGSRSCNLFSDCSCPMLETLTISCCEFADFNILSISATSLKVVKLLDVDDDHALSFRLSNPNLRLIHYEGNKLPGFTSETLSSLVNATFELMSASSALNVAEKPVCKLLNGIHNVNTLKLRGHFIEVLTRIRDLFVYFGALRCSLKHLELIMDPTKEQLQVITFLLRICSALQSLSICFFEAKDPPELPTINDCSQSKELSTGHIPMNLRTVKIQEFQGSESEIGLVQYLLQNASSLEVMSIEYQNETIKHEDNRTRISEKLLTFARVSPYARIFMS